MPVARRSSATAQNATTMADVATRAAAVASARSTKNATMRRTNPGRFVTSASSASERAGRTRRLNWASAQPPSAPSVFVHRSVVSNVRYAYGYTPKSPVNCASSMASDARKPSATVGTIPRRMPRRAMNPNGTNSAAFATSCATAAMPSSRMSSTKCSGFKMGASP